MHAKHNKYSISLSRATKSESRRNRSNNLLQMRNISALRAFALHPSINTADLSKPPRLVLKNQCHLHNLFVHYHLPLETVERAILTLQLCKSKERIAIRKNGLSIREKDCRFLLLLFFKNPCPFKAFVALCVCSWLNLVYSFMHLYHYCFEQDFLSCIFT